MSAELFAKAFEDGVDKGYDHIPSNVFLTPAERKERKRQRQAELLAQKGQNSQSQQQQPDSRQDRKTGDSRSSRDDRGSHRHHDNSYERDVQYSQDSRQPADYDRRDSRRDQQQLDRIASPAMTDNYYQPPGSDVRRGYNPQDYQPRDDRYSSRDPYPRPASANAARTGSSRYDSRASYDDGYSSDDRDRRSRRKSHSSKNKRSSRSRSRSGIRGKLDGKFDKSDRGLTSGAIGAIAGGLVGNEVGKGIVPTIAGVVLGGLGANAYEARDKAKSRDTRDRKDTHLRRARSSAGYGDGDRSSGRHKDSYDDDYYKYEEGRGSSRRDSRSGYGRDSRDSYGGGYGGDRGYGGDDQQSSAGYGGNGRPGESRKERKQREELEETAEKQRTQGGKGVFS